VGTISGFLKELPHNDENRERGDKNQPNVTCLHGYLCTILYWIIRTSKNRIATAIGPLRVEDARGQMLNQGGRNRALSSAHEFVTVRNLEFAR
jgi:hypothetical protein